MTKLETIEYITVILKDNFDKKFVDVSHRDIAIELLSRLEDIGMKPPVKEKCPILLTDKYSWRKE